MDIGEFRDIVVDILKQEFKDEEFFLGDREDLLHWRDTEISLQNLCTEYHSANFDSNALRTAVADHFGRVLSMFRSNKNIIPEEWDEARPRVRLQLMPASFCRPDFSVTYPFLDDVLVSVVVDADNGYAYVRQEDLTKWEINSIDLYEVARDNLEEASRNLDVSYVAGPPALLALGSQDGYDAARLLLPRLREFAIERLGSPFFAGIPNRDFLIMWSQDGPEEICENIRSQLISDSQSRSHPLTPRVLRVTNESISPL